MFNAALDEASIMKDEDLLNGLMGHGPIASHAAIFCQKDIDLKCFPLQVLWTSFSAIILCHFMYTPSPSVDCKDAKSARRPCPYISSEKILDRVIQYSEHLYKISEESYTIFEESFIPVRSQKGRRPAFCYPRAFPMPRSKSEIRHISDQWLLHAALVMAESWVEPVLYLHNSLEQDNTVPRSLVNRIKWVATKLHRFEKGITILIQKMLDEGHPIAEMEQPLVGFEVNSHVLGSILRDYGTLNCFRKDTHKIETFLKILKCRQMGKVSCSI
ncbi:somatolactin beta [Heptranchias perlo]|uniref:somatolactin beta n=1 Tax=Heptranchias perlo TaxID=212740 RepID=UPI003559FC4A